MTMQVDPQIPSLAPALEGSQAVPGLLITSEIIALHTPALLAFAQRALFRLEDAEDAVQETWVSALKSAHTFEGRSSLRTWLTGILRRRIFDRYHAQSRVEPLFGEPVMEDHDQLDELDLREAASYVTTGLSELREQERTAIMLCDVDDWDRDEAAEHMQITRGHLRVILHRARTKLEQHLKGVGVSVQVLQH
ncbi:MAG: RNA polymerase sigma factor [Myxococcales bacterium]